MTGIDLGRKEDIKEILDRLEIKEGDKPKRWKEPFEPTEGQAIPHDKWTLREYLEQFDLWNDPEELEARADEIMSHVRNVMNRYVKMGKEDPLGAYYIEAFEKIEDAYESGDFEKEFPNAVDFMILSVQWE